MSTIRNLTATALYVSNAATRHEYQHAAEAPEGAQT